MIDDAPCCHVLPTLLKHTLIIVCVGMMSSGCALTQPTPPKTEHPPLSEQEALQQAITLVAEGLPKQAVPQLLAIRDNTQDPAIKASAIQTCAKAFAAQGDFKSAINVLSPLPPLVLREEQAISNAMAGEYYLRMGAYKLAIPCIERALYNELPKKHTDWRAAAFFNYGKCALSLNMPRRAQALFSEAQLQFKHLNHPQAVILCQTLLTTIDRAILQQESPPPHVK